MRGGRCPTRVLMKRAGQFAQDERNDQDILVLRECSSGLSIQAVEKPLYAVAVRNVLGKRSRQPDRPQVFPSRLEVSRPHGTLRGLGRGTPPLPASPPRLKLEPIHLAIRAPGRFVRL